MKIDELKTTIHEAKHFAGGCVNALDGLAKMLAIVEEVGEQDLREAIIRRHEGEFLQAASLLIERFLEMTDRVKAIASEADGGFLQTDCGK